MDEENKKKQTHSSMLIARCLVICTFVCLRLCHNDYDTPSV